MAKENNVKFYPGQYGVMPRRFGLSGLDGLLNAGIVRQVSQESNRTETVRPVQGQKTGETNN